MTTDTSTATISVFAITPTSGHGDLLALADVELVLDGVVVVLHGVQIRANADKTEIALPRYRAPDGTWKAAVSLPDEVCRPMGDAVIAAGIEVGILRQRM